MPNDKSLPAIILETKNSKENVTNKKWQNELIKNIEITKKKYNKVIGILYNGLEAIVYKDDKIYTQTTEILDKDYYLNLYETGDIPKKQIYEATKRINDNLHFNFGINNLKHRMIFTACALVADKNRAELTTLKGKSFETLQRNIIETLQNSYDQARQKNLKLDIIKEQFERISYNYTKNQKAIDDFIDEIAKISGYINNSKWCGEDVMSIFFNEFTRYKGKSEAGQVFTPDHITSLMYRITNTRYKDRVLDACCGSGAFLVKAMNNMINEQKSQKYEIQNERLFGIEFDKELFTLACANMLIHKDGKTNLTQMDTRTKEACEWIKSKNITRVLMNPPFENKYGCLDIVKNVLDNVSDDAICGFILPDTKLEIARKKVEKWLLKHRLLQIIKLPDIFAGMAGNQTSIFIFRAHEPQNDNKIFACWIKDDGLETVKNQGRQDIKGKWQEIEDYFVDVIYKQNGDETCQWLDPKENLSYKMPEIPFEITQKDFKKVVLDFMLFENGIDKKEFEKVMLESVLFDSDISVENSQISINLGKNDE